MTLARVVAFGRSRTGSLLAASVGLSAVLLLVHHAGPHNVLLAITRSVAVLPLVFFGELISVSFEACALRTLYGSDRHKIPTSELVRATFIMYAVAGLAPAGRPVGEGVRGAILSRWTSGVRAAASGAKQQALLLIVQSWISIPCAIAAVALHARPIVTFAIVINAGLTFVVGGAVLYAARLRRVAGWLGKLAPSNREFGSDFNALLMERIPARAYGFATLARVVQSTQYAFLLLALGHGFSVVRGLCAEGVHMVGASIGDLIPSHVGVTEANFRLAAHALGLNWSDALAIPLVVHFVQLLWITIGTIVGAFWPSADSATRNPRALAERERAAVAE